jgi:hypothetical protein
MEILRSGLVNKQPKRFTGCRSCCSSRVAEPWRIGMKAKPETEGGKFRYRKCEQTVEFVFGIINFAMASPDTADEASKTSPPSGS